MRKCLSYAGILFVAAFLFAQPSKADNFDTFQLTGPGLSISFTLPQTLTPSSVGLAGLLNISNVTGTYDGGAYTFANIQIGPVGYNNLTNYAATGSLTKSVAVIVPGLFTWNSDGTITLNTGTFALGRSTLTVVDPPGPTVGTPEPGSLLLLGVGGLALAAFRRRKAV